MRRSTIQHNTGSHNQTSLKEVLILGFQTSLSFRVILFSVFLITYILTLSGNFLIIVLMLFSKLLQSPMYYFLCHLSLSEILFTTSITPNMLHVILRNGATISITGCLTQFFLFGLFATTECLLLTVMSYDRYLAICSPLHYTSIMNHSLCLYLSLTCWFVALLIMLISLGFFARLNLCKLKSIDHFFCDFAPILELSCSDTSTSQMVVSLLSAAATLIPFIFIIVTYVSIIRTILSIHSVKGKKKTFSTCSSHLSVVFTYYTTIITVYVIPASGHSLLVNKVLSLLYTVLTPLLNPIIYSLRNQEIRAALRCIFHVKKTD
ncbi:olfactory receptor 6Y1-like [Rhinophrynus dorsalis]